MKKLLVVVVLTVCLGLVGGVFADQASAFFGNLFGGGKACSYGGGYGAYGGGYGAYGGGYGAYGGGYGAYGGGCGYGMKKKMKKDAVPTEKKAKPAPAKKK